MTLAYGKNSPQDMLAKAERDLARFEAAESNQDDEAVSDALFDLAVSLTSIKDWLREHPATSYTPTDVEAYVASSVALDSFRDIANGGKHRIIRKYVPETIKVSASASAIVEITTLPGQGAPSQSQYRLKIIRADGTRHRASDLGRAAVTQWRTFIAQHGVA